ncbi:hypothetical protein PAXINDRAFT_162818 [Paxillus involutus ATCC 200175]|uniref:Unplaced genomic scaffold PAXINscaffold_13, whole genome shotgun sequence n=1 Tax=Paxillus involutus ATCC 200175 TaxID=664439 RepID=A0A0C9U9T7_PAXIN|nr:hypothetical protein PAXINDRAFT_162818 [Paxillus involutus ATCC 200175]
MGTTWQVGFFQELADGQVGEGINTGCMTITIVNMFLCQGVVLCSPTIPTTGVTLDALESFCIAHNHNPHFLIQAYVKTLCDLQGVCPPVFFVHSLLTLFQVQFKGYRSHQFSIVFDVYLQILRHINNWCLKNSCPACTYTLEGEHEPKFKLLYAMDGNNSLEHAVKQNTDNKNLHNAAYTLKEEIPIQQLACDRYLTREEVDRFTNDIANVQLTGGRKNMKDDHMARMWGVFNETGIFMAVCHHGFSLLIADMVQSRECAKYPLPIMSRLLNAYGLGLGGGYDIGCKFKTTLAHSSIGACAKALKHTSLVGTFHGHHLGTYVEGLILEDLEGCECTFSKPNMLTSSVQYASIFHWQQTISSYFNHNENSEVYQNLSMLTPLMNELSIKDKKTFNDWLTEERAYLTSRKKEPEEETLQMMYWQKLVNLSVSKGWTIHTPGTALHRSYIADVSATTRAETARHHTLEVYEKDLAFVHKLEVKLGVEERWTAEHEEWRKAGLLVANCGYQHVLDTLESLVVAQIFELGRMNRAGTGYKLPFSPRHMLSFEDVVEYTFLADFDLLRDTREDILQRPWASPTAQLTMDLYFKMCRAEEEKQCLDIEIQWFVMYLRDEDHYLWGCEDQLCSSDPALAYQVEWYCNVRARYNDYHLCKLSNLASLPGFGGSLSAGPEEEEKEETSEECSCALEEVLLVASV